MRRLAPALIALLALGGCPERPVDDPADDTPRPVVRAEDPDPDAPTARVELPPVPPEDAPAASPRLEDGPDAAELSGKITTWFDGHPGRRIHLHTDKPLYKPGETIWVSSYDLATKSLDGANTPGDATLALISPKGAPVIEKRLQRTAGRAHNDLVLPEGVQGGEYLVRLSAWDGTTEERPVIVSAYEPPRVKKTLEFVRKAYGPGDEVTATIEVKRPTGEPLPSHPLVGAIRLDGEDLPRVALTTNADGGGLVRFTLPDAIRTGDGLLTVLVEDGGVTESISKRIPIVLSRMELGFFPEGGAMVQGLPTRLYFEAKNPIGKPADVEGRIVDDRGQAVARFRTHDRGLGRIDFTPAVGRTYHATITKPVGITETTPLPLAEEAGCVLRHFDDLDGQQEAVRVSVACTEEQDVVVTAMVRENLLDAAPVHVAPGAPAVVHLASDDAALASAMGVATVTVFDGDLNPVAERIVFRQRRSRLQIAIEPDQEAYVPREQVALKVTTKDGSGEAVAADLSLAVVDDTVLSFADDKTGHMLSRLYLEPEIPGDVEEPNVYFDLTEEKGALGMDLLMGTRGWRTFDWQPVIHPPMPVTGASSRSGLLGALGSELDFNQMDGVFGDAGLDDEVAAELAEAVGGMNAQVAAVDELNEAIAPRGKGEALRKQPQAKKEAKAPARPKPPEKPMAPPPPEEPVAANAEPMPAADPEPEPVMDRRNDGKDDVAGARQRRARGPRDGFFGGGRGMAGEMALEEEMADGDWAGFDQERIVAYAPVRLFPAPDYSGTHDGPRTDFRETIHWEPQVRTDRSGEATVTFYLSDAVTSFRAIAEGVGGGAAGHGEEVLTSKLPFSMHVKLPLAVSQGDRLELPLTLTNEQSSELPLSLTSSFGDLLSLSKPVSLGGPALAPEARESLWHEVEVTGVQGASVVRFAANAGGLEDAFERTVTVEPLGFPQTEDLSGELTDVATHSLDLGDLEPGTATAKVTLYPSPVATLVQGMEGILREPSGCFEQTSSSNYPNVMVMQYLEANDVAAPDLVARTQGMLDRGYNKLVGYESTDKGYEWFGRAPAHEALTAYGLLEFADMRDVYGKVDEAMIARTAKWLASRRDGKGGFKRDGKALDSFGRAAPEVTDAYIVYSLAEAGMLAGFEDELGRQKEQSADVADPYRLALAANTLLNAPGEKAAGVAAAKRLARMQDKAGHFPGADHSITRSGGTNLDIETTALAAMALMDAGGHDGAVRDAIAWLNENRGGYGQWGATQATVLALKAMTEYTTASRVIRGSGAVTLVVNGEEVATEQYADGRRDPITFEGFGALLTAGANSIELRHTGEHALPYSVAVEYRSDTPADHPDAAVQIATRLEATEVPMGEAVRLWATVTNTTDEGQPMTLARVGLPGGLTSQTWQLKELRDKGDIGFFETRAREVVLYLDGLAPGETKELPLDLVATVPGTYTGPASSGYLYYTNDQRTWAPGLEVRVTR